MFSTSELQHMAISIYRTKRTNNFLKLFFFSLGSISEGGSTKEVLGPDYLGSMLKMETDDYADVQPISNAQQPDLLKMCRSRYVTKKTSRHDRTLSS